jgi:guanyl-specific ribonuclease Sa
VLLADGRKIPISKIKPGMKVVATDPTTSTTAARRVDAVIVHGGKHTMVDLTFADGSRISATDRHPFWDASTGQFTYAIDLQAGEQVREADGQLLTISNTRSYTADLIAYNLTIDGIHTYYAGTTPVLVHNSCADGARFVASREGIIDTASPRLQQQAESVATQFLETGQVPAGIRQGAFQGQPGVFGNVAGDLPARPTGYYTEMDVWPGPGPRGAERLVVGGPGEAWYSPDHYGTFRSVF